MRAYVVLRMFYTHELRRYQYDYSALHCLHLVTVTSVCVFWLINLLTN